jgi:hypothetical protein
MGERKSFGSKVKYTTVSVKKKKRFEGEWRKHEGVKGKEHS